MGWEPLPLLLYGFAVHPLNPNPDRPASSVGPPRLELDAIPEYAPRNPHIARLDVGDEIYAFEVWRGEDRQTWYRGYIVCTSNTPAVPAPAPDPEPTTGLVGVPPPPEPTAIEDPQVTIGIFPATHVHVRDELPDAEGRLAHIIAKARTQQQQPSARTTSPSGPGAFHMATLREDDEMSLSDLQLSSRNQNTQEKQEAPRPTLKSGDETAAGLVEPLVDEIASALREWHARLFTYLARRDYRTFTAVREHIDALHLGRRQLLARTISGDEAIALRRECVMRLVRGNVAQGLDVLVRHPAGGALVGIEVDFTPPPLANSAKRPDTSNWVSTIRMYAMQSALAYIDAQPHGYKPSALGPVQDLFISPAPSISLSSPIQTSPTSRHGPSNPRPKFFHLLLDLRAFVAAPCAPGEFTELFFSIYSRATAAFVTEDFCVVLNRNGVRVSDEDMLASPAAREANDLAEFGGLRHNASSLALSLSPLSPSSSASPIRTLFTDLGAHDIAEGLVLVCRIIRRGGMKLAPDGDGVALESSGIGNTHQTATIAGTTYQSNTMGAISESYPGANTMSELGHSGGEREYAMLGSRTESARRGSEPMYRSVWEDSVSQLEGRPGQARATKGSNGVGRKGIVRNGSGAGEDDELLRRPFGCAVLELDGLLNPMVAEHAGAGAGAASVGAGVGSGVGPAREHTMPIFVPSDEARFSTLHQDILKGHGHAVEKSPRAEMLAITLKAFYGDSTAIVYENSSLLHSTPLTSRLGFPDVIQDKDELAEVLSKFTFVGEVEIVKFLRDIFDALFAVLVSALNARAELDDLVFSALVTVLGIVQDRRFTNFQPVLDVYIDSHFSCAAAAGHMVHSMNRLLASPSGEETASPLRAAFKVWHYVFRFIVRARQLQQAHEVGMGVTSEHLEKAFKRELMAHLNEVNKVMAGTSPDIIGTQTIALQHFTSILPDLATTFSSAELVGIVTGFANSLINTKGKLVIWKLLMYTQLVRSFVFDDPKSRSMLVESIISWIKPHFGRFNEFTMTSAGDSDATRDAARVSWLETTRLCVTVVATMLDKLQMCLVDPVIRADRRLFRQEEDNVEFLLSLLPR
ncbi:hypothetical protein FS749_007930 [Ceratobasidium sp. UAMH 11750]|nr:hypothetical protein FS749_007930 [Ceratobasidium sp. UAMH 11750]